MVQSKLVKYFPGFFFFKCQLFEKINNKGINVPTYGQNSSPDPGPFRQAQTSVTNIAHILEKRSCNCYCNIIKKCYFPNIITSKYSHVLKYRNNNMRYQDVCVSPG